MRRLSRLWIPATLCLCSCQSWGDLLIFGPGLIRPGSLPSVAAPTAGPVPPTTVWRVQAEFYLDGQVRLNGTPLSAATVTVVDLGTGAVLAQDGRADDAGKFRVSVATPVEPGTLLLVRAQSGETALVAMVQAQAHTAGGNGGGPQSVGHAGISLASTLVTKKVLPKVMEAIVTDSGTPDSAGRLRGIMAQAARLERDTAILITDIPSDDRFRRALDEARVRPTEDAIDTLAVNAVQYSALRGGFADVVDAANGAVVANILEGGPIVFPRPWQVGTLIIEPPSIQRSGYDTVTILHGGRRREVPVRPRAFEEGEDRRPLMATIDDGLHNAPPPPPTSGGGGGGVVPPPVPLLPRIAFVSDQLHANNDVFTVKTDGTDVTALTDDLLEDKYPAFSPDGSKIAFYAGGTLCVMAADGTNRQSLAAAMPFFVPSWSPDGTKIAYAANRLGNIDIYVYYLTTSTETAVTTAPQPDVSPKWSPDGNFIAFISNRAVADNVFVVRPNGADEFRVTTDTIAQSNPSWSPDGQWIVFEAKRDLKLYRIKPDGTGEFKLTTAAGPGRDAWPTWSPDGQTITFVKEVGLTSMIQVVKPDGTGETALTTLTATDRSPVWSADSQSIVFVFNRSGQFDLYRMKADGSDMAPILTRPAKDDTPSL